MKLLLLIPSLAPVYGGTSRIILDLAAALHRNGVAVDVVATDADGPGSMDVPRGRWIEQDGYRVRYFPRWGRREFKFSPALFAWLLGRVADYDAVHISSIFNFPVLAGALACRVRKVPYVLTPQGMLEPWALDYKAAKKRLYLNGIERPLVLRGASLIQALNGNEAANLEKLALGPPVAVLPNGIGPADLRPADPADAEAFLARFPALRDKTLILFLHRVDPKKGLDLLAPAFAAVRGRFPRAHLVVAGPALAGFEETARGYFQAAGVAGEVTFTGMLDGAGKRGALHAAELFVAPSYSEGFSMSVLEAMAAGLPCVITTGCNFPEAGEAGVARVVPPDADAFAGALGALLADPAAGRAMGAGARELVLAGYTWDAIAARFKALIRAGLEGKTWKTESSRLP